MCRNVIDGRFHKRCQHFKPISTRRQDCLDPDCLYSDRHPAECTLKDCRCKRSMASPFLNAIRLSPIPCPECARAEASAQEEGTCT